MFAAGKAAGSLEIVENFLLADLSAVDEAEEMGFDMSMEADIDDTELEARGFW